MFLVIGIGYALGGVSIRGFALGAGAVLYVGLGVGMFAPQAAPPPLLGSLGLLMFVYPLGIMYGRQFFSGLASPFGLKANALVLLSHLAGIVVCYVAYTAFSVAPSAVVGLFCGALTSTPALQAAISAVGDSTPALSYIVAYPLGFIAPFLCMHFTTLWLGQTALAPTGSGPEFREIVARNRQVVGRSLAEISADLPSGVRVVVVRKGNQNQVPTPDMVLAHGDTVALAGESDEALEKARSIIGELAPGRITGDRADLDYFRLFVSRPAVVGVSLANLQIPGVPEFSVVQVRRGDADLVPRPELVLEFGDRVGLMVKREHRDVARKHFGDSIKGTTEFSYIALAAGMALGMLLGILPIPIPGLGTLSLGVAGGPLVVGLILGRLGRTGSWVWTMPVSANLILRNLGLTLFIAQVSMSLGPKFLETVQQTGPLFVVLGAAITLVAVPFNLLVGHFVFKFPLDDLLGATCGVAANPAHAVFASKLVPTERTDVAYALTFPTGTIMKILLLQIMLVMMGNP
jgi:putative transport protein